MDECFIQIPDSRDPEFLIVSTLLDLRIVNVKLATFNRRMNLNFGFLPRARTQRAAKSGARVLRGRWGCRPIATNVLARKFETPPIWRPRIDLETGDNATF